MSAADRFRELNTVLARHLAADGFRRSGQWFTHQCPGSRNVVAVNLRKLPQPGSKRIVLQVVTYAGRLAAPASVRIASLAAATAVASYEHRLLDGAVEHYFTIWPSSDAGAIATGIYDRLKDDAFVAADKHLANHPAGGNHDAPAR